MTITVFYIDLRTHTSQLAKFLVEWKPNITAKEVVENCLNETKAQIIEKDLRDNNHEIIVSWWHKPSGKISEIGGVGTLLWSIADETVLTVNYENDRTTSNQLDESTK